MTQSRAERIHEAQQRAKDAGFDAKAYALRMTDGGKKPWIGGSALKAKREQRKGGKK